LPLAYPETPPSVRNLLQLLRAARATPGAQSASLASNPPVQESSSPAGRTEPNRT
jgi:hypothetical protein